MFCETGVYTVDESRAILTAARDAGMLLKLHADELTSVGGAELAASLGATSADHLAAVSDAASPRSPHARTVATLLPGTMLFLGKTKQAPARALHRGRRARRAGDRFQSRHVAHAELPADPRAWA